MKTDSTIIVLLILGLIGMSALTALKPVNINLTGKINGNPVESENSIQVTGQSILNVDPDKAEIIIGIETQEENALDSQQGNAEIMEKVMIALKNNGIKTKDIKTYEYSFYPIRDYNSKSGDYQEIIGYRTTNMIKIMTTDLDNVGKVIDAAASAGANKFQGVSFGLTDEKQEEYINKVLKEASKNSREKADSIADGLGVKIQNILSASESSYYQPIYRDYDMAKVASGSMESTTEISPGMIQISATVSVSYGFV